MPFTGDAFELFFDNKVVLEPEDILESCCLSIIFFVT